MRLRLSSVCFWLLSFALLAFAFHLSGQDGLAQTFNPGCTVPFDAIKEHHPIDDSCSIEGVGASDAHLAQNRAKNNFCAATAPIRISYNSFLRLQRTAEQKDIPFGSSNSLPEDRSALKDLYTTNAGIKLGEGSVVQFVAFIIDAHHSNLSKGESVNCKRGGRENNDIHIELGRTPDEDPCDSITAEISPHLRPTPWDQLSEINLGRHPVRITGQLFFDASHKPCTAEKRTSPPRASIWEIHPVYAIDVCKKTTLAGCKAGGESSWVSLDQWHAIEEEGPGVARKGTEVRQECSLRLVR